MIVSKKKQLQKYIYRLVLWMTIISMVIGAGILSIIKQGGNQKSTIATVNGYVIDYYNLKRRAEAKQGQIQLMRYQFAQKGLPFEGSVFDVDPQKLAFNSLIEDALLDSVANSLHLHLSDQTISLKLMDPYYIFTELTDFIPPYVALSMQTLDTDVLVPILRSKGLTIADFEYFVEQNMKRKIVKDLVNAALYVPHFLVRDIYAGNYSAKKFSALRFSYDGLLKKEKQTPLSDDELNSFFNQQRSAYTVPEKRDGLIWEFSPESYGISISPESIKQYYDRNKSTFIETPMQIKVRHILMAASSDNDMTAARAKAAMVYDQVTKSPELFAEKAQQFSDDAPTAKNGGVIDFFARGEQDPDFERVAFGLKKDGDISNIFQTKRGLELVQRVERKPAVYKSFDGVKNEIKTLLLQQTFKRQFTEDMERVNRELANDPEALDRFAQEKKAKKRLLSGVEKKDDPVVERLFKIKKVRSISYYRTEDNGSVIQLTGIKRSYLPEFSVLKEQVMNDLYQNKARQTLQKLVQEAQQKAATTPLSDLATLYGAPLVAIDWVKGSDTERVKKLSKEGFPITQMLQLEKPGSLISAYEDQDAYLVRLDEVEPFNEQDFTSKEQEIKHAFIQNNNSLVLNGFIASLNRTATIESNEKLFEVTEDCEQ